MKRTLLALLSVTVVMLFAVSAFALHAVPEQYEYTPSMVKAAAAQIEIGGHIRIRGEMNDNYVDFSDDVDTDNTRSFYDQRARVHLKATVSPNTFGMIEFEANDGLGDNSDDNWDWGQCDAAKGIYRVANCKPTGVSIRQAYIAHQTKYLGFLSGFKLGHQLVALGNGMFYDHTQYGDDVITLWMSPWEGSEISLNFLKHGEGNTAYADDIDTYVLTYAGALGPASVSADLSYVNDNSDAWAKGLDFYNIGVRGDWAGGIFKVKADLEYQFGTADESAFNGDDLDVGGWAFMLGSDIDLGMVMLSLEGAYGSGDDIDTEDEYEGFVTSLSDGEQYTYLYDQKAKTSAQAVAPSAASSSVYFNTYKTGLNNTWYIMAGVSGNATPDLKLGLDLFYLQASEKVSDVSDFDDKDIGWEVDGKLSYQIDKNLVYYVEAGYLFAGDFYANVTGDKDNIDDAYSVRNGVILSF